MQDAKCPEARFFSYRLKFRRGNLTGASAAALSNTDILEHSQFNFTLSIRLLFYFTCIDRMIARRTAFCFCVSSGLILFPSPRVGGLSGDRWTC